MCQGKTAPTHLSTSSLSMINSFFNTLIAYKLFDVFSSANITFPKLPFPSTAKKLKSSRPTFLFFAICCCGCGCCCGGGGGRWAHCADTCCCGGCCNGG